MPLPEETKVRATAPDTDAPESTAATASGITPHEQAGTTKPTAAPAIADDTPPRPPRKALTVSGLGMHALPTPGGGGGGGGSSGGGGGGGGGSGGGWGELTGHEKACQQPATVIGGEERKLVAPPPPPLDSHSLPVEVLDRADLY